MPALQPLPAQPPKLALFAPLSLDVQYRHGSPHVWIVDASGAQFAFGSPTLASIDAAISLIATYNAMSSLVAEAGQ